MNWMLIRSMGISLLEADPTQIFIAFTTIKTKFLVMLFAIRKSIHFIYALYFVSVHHSSVMMVLRTLLAKIKLLIRTVYLSSFVLTVHTLKLTLNKLFFTANRKMNLIEN